jgi:hypothetical protein
VSSRTRIVVASINLEYRQYLSEEERKKEEKRNGKLLVERFLNNCPEMAHLFSPIPHEDYRQSFALVPSSEDIRKQRNEKKKAKAANTEGETQAESGCKEEEKDNEN